MIALVEKTGAGSKRNRILLHFSATARSKTAELLALETGIDLRSHRIRTPTVPILQEIRYQRVKFGKIICSFVKVKLNSLYISRSRLYIKIISG